MSKYNGNCTATRRSPYSTLDLKVMYPTLEDALEAREDLLKCGRNQRAYKCNGCGAYHLTTKGNNYGRLPLPKTKYQPSLWVAKNNIKR
jgi:hypothetical protein